MMVFYWRNGLFWGDGRDCVVLDFSSIQAWAYRRGRLRSLEIVCFGGQGLKA